MAFPQNDWGRLVPPADWGLLRNFPLIIVGIAVAYLLLRYGFKENDKRYQYFGYTIVASFFFYIPVILFVRDIPILGMLMIPKTVAYMILAWLTYKYYYLETAEIRLEKIEDDSLARN